MINGIEIAIFEGNVTVLFDWNVCDLRSARILVLLSLGGGLLSIFLLACFMGFAFGGFQACLILFFSNLGTPAALLGFRHLRSGGRLTGFHVWFEVR